VLVAPWTPRCDSPETCADDTGGMPTATYETNWYTSRRLPAPAGRTAAALDQLSRDDDRRIELDHDGIRLSAVTIPVAVGRGDGPVRRLRGLLRPRGFGGPFAVELEVTGWSRRESEVAIRPAGTRPPWSRADRYFDTVHELIDELRDRLLVAATQPEAQPEMARAS